MVKILCVIPARSGSKGIINKNIKLYNGKPLIAWTIEQIKRSKHVNNMKIIVSTDSEIYKNLVLEYGVDVPFLRPTNISTDSSTDYEFITHAVEWLNEFEHYTSDIILQLRPTSPLRKTEDIDKALTLFMLNRHTYDSLRSIIPVDKSPYKMYNIENDTLIPLFKNINGISEPYNICRQNLPLCYLHNGYIDILNTSILKNKTISGTKILPFIMSSKDSNDIDLDCDWYY